MFGVIASAVGTRQLVGWFGGMYTGYAPRGGIGRNGPLWSTAVSAVAVVARRRFPATILVLTRLVRILLVALAVALASARPIPVSTTTVAIAVASGTRFVRS